VDIGDSKWYYNDSLGWPFPPNLKKLLMAPFVSILRNSYNLSLPTADCASTVDYVLQGKSYDLCGFSDFCFTFSQGLVSILA
jgi:hypothetical protein